MAEKIYICPQRTFTLRFKVPQENIVDGMRVLDPGMKAVFDNFVCRATDEKLQEEIENSPHFTSGFIKEFNPQKDKIPTPKIATGKKMLAKSTGRK